MLAQIEETVNKQLRPRRGNVENRRADAQDRGCTPARISDARAVEDWTELVEPPPDFSAPLMPADALALIKDYVDPDLARERWRDFSWCLQLEGKGRLLDTYIGHQFHEEWAAARKHIDNPAKERQPKWELTMPPETRQIISRRLELILGALINENASAETHSVTMLRGLISRISDAGSPGASVRPVVSRIALGTMALLPEIKSPSEPEEAQKAIINFFIQCAAENGHKFRNVRDLRKSINAQIKKNR